MALLWFDGFELDRTLTSLALNYPANTFGWPATIPASNGRFGGLSLKSVDGTVCAVTTDPLPWTLPSNARLMYYGIAMRCQSPGNGQVFGAQGGVIPLTSWSIHTVDNGTSFELALYDSDDAVVFTTSAAFSFGEWLYVEVSVMSQDAGAWELKINGSTVSSGTGDFLPGTTPHAKAWIQWPSLTSPAYFEVDDWYVSEDGFLGPQFTVEGLVPDRDGAFTDWSPKSGGSNFSQVDDDGDSDGDGTYVHTDLDGNKDVYIFPGLSLVAGSIVATRIQYDARNTDANNRDISPEFVTGGGAAQDSPFTIIGQSYQRLSRILELSPVSGQAWQKGEFTDLGLGMTKGVGTSQPVLDVYDELGVLGYMVVNSAGEHIPLYDELGVSGEMPTHDSNTNLALFDENGLEGDFPLNTI